jgi:hypothetical protein
LHRSPWIVAAPSFVWPATVGENCRRLQHLVHEVSVVLFDTRHSLEYTEEDLPPDLASLPLTYHVHLPLDLPWTEGTKAVLGAVRGLRRKVAPLEPRCFVLHPPRSRTAFLDFVRAWRDSGLQDRDLVLENIAGNDLRDLWPDILQTRCRVCLDLGHITAFGQERLLEAPGLWERVCMLHVYGDKRGDSHLSLQELTPRGHALLQSMLRRLPAGCVVVLEVFSPSDLHSSLDSFFRLAPLT